MIPALGFDIIELGCFSTKDLIQLLPVLFDFYLSTIITFCKPRFNSFISFHVFVCSSHTVANSIYRPDSAQETPVKPLMAPAGSEKSEALKCARALFFFLPRDRGSGGPSHWGPKDRLFART